MLLILAVLLGIAWLLGFTVFHVASGAIHLLIVLAVIAAIVHCVSGGRPAARVCRQHVSRRPLARVT